ncbi:MAG: DHHA1 domain-containing protein, partial [Acidimicrobiales bacterium]
ELARDAVGGVVVARVDGVSRDDLKELAQAVKHHAEIDAVVLGSALSGGGAALVAAVEPASGYVASDLIADAAKAISGGGGKGAEFAMAGGRDADAIDDALGLVRAAASKS